MSAATLDRSPKNGPKSPEARFAAHRALAAANADVSVCENQALNRAAAESLAARRRLETPKTA
jgi:hypothetical protein